MTLLYRVGEWNDYLNWKKPNEIWFRVVGAFGEDVKSLVAMAESTKPQAINCGNTVSHWELIGPSGSFYQPPQGIKHPGVRSHNAPILSTAEKLIRTRNARNARTCWPPFKKHTRCSLWTIRSVGGFDRHSFRVKDGTFRSRRKGRRRFTSPGLRGRYQPANQWRKLDGNWKDRFQLIATWKKPHKGTDMDSSRICLLSTERESCLRLYLK